MYSFCLYLFTVCGLAAGALQSETGGCVLPEYPPHGIYTVHNKAVAAPGQVYDSAILMVTCDPGYGVVGSNFTYCFGRNVWQQPMPQCTRFCRLTPHPSINYYCKITGDGVVSGTRACHELEPHGTEVVPECNRPVYYSSSVLLNMRCVDGTWDHVAVCQPDCGTPTAVGQPLVFNGTRTKRGELPWHAGVYDKTFTPFMQICGGSLISTRVVISAAHCFWMDREGLQPASKYAIALGKIYRQWEKAMDTETHKSDVSEIKIPVRYLGEAGHYQEDIALVFMSTPVIYRTYIRPVCIDFSPEFDKNQLQNSNSGRISGWGLTSADGSASPVLWTAELPYVDVEKCIAEVPYAFRPYITSDKFCAGIKNGTGVCRGDSGGGLAFPSVERGVQRYYLRGVVAPAPYDLVHKCNVDTFTILTHIQHHAAFIKEHVLF
ncbi:transmembrane protease serine 12-like isoform X1 [Choristoneura fumiferana]|uniref:transmembrane protease serine 12-like isoform X1 n=1 Tax=Choristoneura fumiferana TaxID=7141 RepID=UPI003D1572DE